MKEKYDKIVQMANEIMDLYAEQMLYDIKDKEYNHINNLISKKEKEISSYMKLNDINKNTVDEDVLLESIRDSNNYK